MLSLQGAVMITTGSTDTRKTIFKAAEFCNLSKLDFDLFFLTFRKSKKVIGFWRLNKNKTLDK